MTAQETEIVDDAPVAADEPKADGPPELRAALKAANARNAKLEAIVMKDVYAAADLDPTKGLGKAIAKEYDGEPTIEGLAEFAKAEYGYDVPEQPDNPVAEQVVEATATADAIRQVTKPVVPDSKDETRRKAEAEGDYETLSQIKGDQLRNLMRPGR